MGNKSEQIRGVLKKSRLDACIFFDEPSVFFFTGFASSHAFYIVSADAEILYTDGRYLASAQAQFSDTPVSVRDMPAPQAWKSLLAAAKLQKLGLSFDRLTATRLQWWEKHSGCLIRDFSRQENELRAAKDAVDIALITATTRLADQALIETLPLLKQGITEKQFAWELEKCGRELGADGVSFSLIVAFGENSALPHHHPTNRKLEKNEAVLIDWGFVKAGFCSDCTRSFFFGKASKDWQQAYQKVLAAQLAGIKELNSGTAVQQPQEAAEKILQEKMVHGFGHGVGTEVHEYPSVSTKGKGGLFTNMVVTAEPGLYFPRKFGIRIEDLLVVTAKQPRSLTKLPKDLRSAVLHAS